MMPLLILYAHAILWIKDTPKLNVDTDKCKSSTVDSAVDWTMD